MLPNYYAVIDFECTSKETRLNWEFEIIEFPCLFLNTETQKIDFEFHVYVKPTTKPTLTEFCINLTGVKQEQVDAASTLDVVLQEIAGFIEEKKLVPLQQSNSEQDVTFAFATDGFFDFHDFLFPECERKNIQIPSIFDGFVDVRNNFRASTKSSGNLEDMLKYFKLDFKGRQHSGLDDSRNIARLITCLMKNNQGRALVWENMQQIATRSKRQRRPRPNDWRCPKCSQLNFESKNKCFFCNVPRPENPQRMSDNNNTNNNMSSNQYSPTSTSNSNLNHRHHHNKHKNNYHSNNHYRNLNNNNNSSRSRRSGRFNRNQERNHNHRYNNNNNNNNNNNASSRHHRHNNNNNQANNKLCQGCGFMNNNSKKQCFRCNMPLPKNEEWSCTKCGKTNWWSKTHCRKCKAQCERHWACGNCQTLNHQQVMQCFACGFAKNFGEMLMNGQNSTNPEAYQQQINYMAANNMVTYSINPMMNSYSMQPSNMPTNQPGNLYQWRQVNQPVSQQQQQQQQQQSVLSSQQPSPITNNKNPNVQDPSTTLTPSIPHQPSNSTTATINNNNNNNSVNNNDNHISEVVAISETTNSTSPISSLLIENESTTITDNSINTTTTNYQPSTLNNAAHPQIPGLTPIQTNVTTYVNPLAGSAPPNNEMIPGNTKTPTANPMAQPQNSSMTSPVTIMPNQTNPFEMQMFQQQMMVSLGYVQQPYGGYQQQPYVQYQQNHNNVSMKEVIAQNHWRCKKCQTHNFHNGTDCHHCGSAWMCPSCSFSNYAFRSKCLRCQTVKPQNPKTPTVQDNTPLAHDASQTETTI